ncbi:MAG: hypothetical protein WC501_00220 [Candidatus Micrarchaeia archaeon]
MRVAFKKMSSKKKTITHSLLNKGIIAASSICLAVSVLSCMHQKTTPKFNTCEPAISVYAPKPSEKKSFEKLISEMQELEKMKQEKDAIGSILACIDTITCLGINMASKKPEHRIETSGYIPPILSECELIDFRILNILEKSMQDKQDQVRINASKTLSHLIFLLKSSDAKNNVSFWARVFAIYPDYFKPGKTKTSFRTESVIFSVLAILSTAKKDSNPLVRSNAINAEGLLYENTPVLAANILPVR